MPQLPNYQKNVTKSANCSNIENVDVLLPCKSNKLLSLIGQEFFAVGHTVHDSRSQAQPDLLFDPNLKLRQATKDPSQS